METGITPEVKPKSEINQQIRTFSKSTPEGQKARSETVQNILESRKNGREILNLINDLKSEATLNQEKSQEHTESAITAQSAIDRYSKELAIQEASWLNRLYQIFNKESKSVKDYKFGLGRWSKYLTTNNRESISNINQYLEKCQKISELEKEKTKITTAQEILDTFYSKQGEMLEKRNQISQLVNIKNISSEKSVYFVHGITPDSDFFANTRNYLLKYNTTWDSRLSIVLGLKPDLGTSTVKRGDNNSNMWSKMGVILSGGELVGASSSDAASLVTGLTKKTSSSFGEKSYYEMEPHEVKTNIAQSIDQREVHSYNELVVRNPEVSGFYVSLDPDIERNTFDTSPQTEIINVISKLGIPIYVIHNGEVYKATYEITSDGLGKIRRTDELINPKDIIQKPFNMTENIKTPITLQAMDALNINV